MSNDVSPQFARAAASIYGAINIDKSTGFYDMIRLTLIILYSHKHLTLESVIAIQKELEEEALEREQKP